MEMRMSMNADLIYHLPKTSKHCLSNNKGTSQTSKSKQLPICLCLNKCYKVSKVLKFLVKPNESWGKLTIWLDRDYIVHCEWCFPLYEKRHVIIYLQIRGLILINL